jgi:YggT family protein
MSFLGDIAVLVSTLIYIYTWILIVSAILSWLIAFNVINTRNQFVYTVASTLYRLTEPALRPIRRILPNLGGVDISPVILILLLWLVQRQIDRLALYLYTQ